MQKQRGISLLELMLGIAIIVTILIASTRFFNIANENAKVNNAINLLHQITDASYKWYENKPNFNNLTFSTLAEAGFLPEKYKAYEKVCEGCNPWGGDIRIEAADDKSKLKIILSGVPDDEKVNKACTKLENQLQEYQASCKENTFTAVF